LTDEALLPAWLAEGLLVSGLAESLLSVWMAEGLLVSG